MAIDWSVARCRGAPPEVFITPGDLDDEPVYPPPEALVYCISCPIKPECLQYAMETGQVGVWGGTSSYQRRQLGRDVERLRCPSCGSTELVHEHQRQLCVACGMSWHMV